MTRPTTVRPDPRVALAHHEAGHAVAAYWLRQQLEIVSIVSNDRADGFVMGEATDWFQADLKVLDDATRRSIAADIIVYLAGPLCEEAIGVPPKNLVYQKAIAHYLPASDLGRSCRLLELVLATAQERERYLATLRDHTARLLLSPGFWPAVEALADVLLEYRELSGEEAVSVIEQALDGAAVS